MLDATGERNDRQRMGAAANLTFDALHILYGSVSL